MARINNFKEIIAWQKAEQLTLAIYKDFNYCKDYSFRDQIQRAAVSIMNNIAEGFERKGDKEFSRFLFIAQGSCAEVRSMLGLSQKLGYINKEGFEKLDNLCLEVVKMLSKFNKVLNDKTTV